MINIEDSLILSYQDKSEFNKKLELDLIITTFNISPPAVIKFLVKILNKFIIYIELSFLFIVFDLTNILFIFLSL